MTSSLASQLAKIGTLDRDRLEAATSKFRPSYLFQARQAASLGNEEIYALGYNGFLTLCSQDGRFEGFETAIFGEKAKITDRALLTKGENARLDATLARLLRLISSKFMLKSAGKLLEWLIRRFRINDFNVDDVLLAILPYHETPQFAQMLQVLKLDDPKFAALLAVKKSMQPMPREHFVTAMSKSHELFSFFVAAAELYSADDCLYATLTAFWVGTITAYLVKLKAIQPQEATILLPAILRGIQAEDKDMRIGACIILSHLSSKTELDTPTTTLLLATLLRNCTKTADDDEVMATLTTAVILTNSHTTTLPHLPSTSATLPPNAYRCIARLAETVTMTAFLRTLLHSTAQVILKDQDQADLLSNLLSSPACPAQITLAAVESLIAACPVHGSIPDTLLKILQAIDQRLPSTASLSSLASPSHRSRAERVISVLSRIEVRTQEETGVSTSSAQTWKHRQESVRASRLAKLLKKGGNSPQITMVVLDALEDSSDSVAQTLFDPACEDCVLSVLRECPDEFLRRCLATDTGSSADAARFFGRQARFVLAHVDQVQNKEWHRSVFRNIIWPYLLPSADNGEISSIVWKMLPRSEWSLLANVVPVRSEKAEEQAEGVSRLVTQLSNNIRSLPVDQRDEFGAFLSQGVQAPTPSILSVLVLTEVSKYGPYSFLKPLFRPHFLQSLRQANLTATVVTQKIAQDIYAKSTSHEVLQSLLGNLAAQICLSFLSQPSGAPWSWLAASSQASDEHAATRGLTLYKLLHSDEVPTPLRAKVTESLFGKYLEPDTLAFLASVYCSDEESSLRLAALKEASAYIAGHAPCDYQVILPSLLSVLSGDDKVLRGAALEVIASMLRLASSPPHKQIYGFDQFYGPTSSKLQYMDASQIKPLLQTCLAEQASLMLSGERVQHVLSATIEARSDTGKKVTSKHGLLSYLVSHLLACKSLPLRLSLMQFVEPLADSKRAEIFAEVISDLLQPMCTFTWSDSQVEELVLYTRLAIKSYRPRVIGDEITGIYVRILRSSNEDLQHQTLRVQAVDQLAGCIIPSATVAQRVAFVEALTESMSNVTQDQLAHWRNALRVALRDPEVALQCLEKAKDAMAAASEVRQQHKKSRSALPEDSVVFIKPLVLTLENLLVDDASISGDLLASLLGCLSSLTEFAAVQQKDTAYATQLVLVKSSEIAVQLGQREVRDDIELRTGPVLEAIRVSNNPSISNGALNLMAELAILSPSQVAQSVMPIFTFMGATILQRDDAQSIRIVEKTIRQIVPALVTQRRQQALTPDQLVRDMEEVLRVFVDASAHVPHHRREHLFLKFVEVLGPSDFLAPVCALMVDKVATRLLKTNDVALLSLPLSISQHFRGLTQVKSVRQQLLIIKQKLEALNSDSADTSVSSRHSSPAASMESPILPVRTSRRTILASLTLVQELLSNRKLASDLQRERTMGSASVQEELAQIATLLIELMAIEPGHLSHADIATVKVKVKQVIGVLLHLTTTEEFAATIPAFLAHGRAETVDLGCDLLAERLKAVKSSNRHVLSINVKSALSQMAQRLNVATDKDHVLGALARIRSLALYCIDEEVPELHRTFLAILTIPTEGYGQKVTIATLKVFITMLPDLPGRIIPSLGQLLLYIQSVISASLEAISNSSARQIVALAFEVIEWLLKMAPTFLAKDLKKILQLCIRAESVLSGVEPSEQSVQTAPQKVLSLCTKDMPIRALTSSLSELYSDELRAKAVGAISVIRIFGQTIRHASPRTVSEVHKELFAQLLLFLDVRSTTANSQISRSAEHQAITAFLSLVLKLSEGMFRPLFLRLVDWTAALGDNAAMITNSRRTTFFLLLDRLLVQLKALSLPYFDSSMELLTSELAQALEADLTKAAIAALSRFFTVAPDDYWTEARLSRIIAPISQQASFMQKDKAHLIDLWLQLVAKMADAAASHPIVLHRFHQAILKEARTDDAATQKAAVQALQSMWRSQAHTELLPSKSESMPVLAELLEAGGEVEKATKELLALMAEGDEDGENYTESGTEEEFAGAETDEE